ncbi:MAG: ABC transporter permease [Anaerolineales bacterium]|nr:ABC transporter permease [Anaerolineales bacterium]
MTEATEANGLAPLPAVRPRRKRSGGPGALTGLSVLAIYALLIAAWDVFGRDVNPYFSSYPSAIVRAAGELARSGELATALLGSLGVLGQGLLYTLAAGLPVGFAIGRYQFLDRTFGPLVTILFVAPREVFVPLLVLWFGLSDASRVIFVFLSAVFPLIYNVADGVRSVNQSHAEIAQAYGANEWQTIQEVTFPSILPFIGVGAKQAIARGLTGLVAAEFFIGVSGLGGLLQKASALYRLDRAFVVILVLVAVGFILARAGDLMEARLGRWRISERAY